MFWLYLLLDVFLLLENVFIGRALVLASLLALIISVFAILLMLTLPLWRLVQAYM